MPRFLTLFDMCFSAAASFTASAILGTAGIVALTQVKDRRELPYACIPLFFALQQAFEGGVWLSVQRGEPSVALAYGFLFFAFLLWPAYVPWTVYLLETGPRKRWIRPLLGVGALVSLILLGLLLRHPLEIQVLGHSLHYNVWGSLTWGWGLSLYLAATAGVLLLSSHAWIRRFGAAVFVSFLLSFFFYTQTYFSVWCFFSAALSVMVLGYLYGKRK